VESLLRGWLVAFAVFSCIPVGSMIWLLIHRLTGGEWGVAAAPVLRPAAAMSPFLIVAFVPVLVGLHRIYPWAADPGAIPADVAHWYLNGTSFLLRSLIALVGWSFFAVVFAAGWGGRLMAGLGLAFFGLTVSLIAVDWYLSLDPHYVATAFGAMIAIQQLLMALAVTALIGPPTLEGKVAGDLGALLIVTLLGVVYLEFMTFVVAWYGDLPEKAAWFLKRSGPGWISVLMAAFVVGAVLPFGMLLMQRVRRSRRGLRIASAAILFGTVLHFIWLLVPGFDDQGVVIATACGGVVVLVLVSYLTGPGLARLLEARYAQ
ncbi:MAG TPA: hypothetical protein VH722_01750, partial [Alphaproteobacteria bacterium]|nr:hypothetical protein [Alphaproteobacteria bacterium]